MTQGSGLPPAAHYDVTECIVVARLGHYPEKVEGMAVMDNGDVYVWTRQATLSLSGRHLETRPGHENDKTPYAHGGTHTLLPLFRS